MFQEGLSLRVVKLFREGELVKGMLDMVLAECKTLI